MEENQLQELGQFASVATRDAKSLTPLRNPQVRILGGRSFMQGIFAWQNEYWLNGCTTLIPLDDVKAIHLFSSEREYLLAVEKHRVLEEKKNQARENADGSTGKSDA